MDPRLADATGADLVAAAEPLGRRGPRFAGKVILVTGAARGQGRSHCLGFAEEGGDVIAVDICRQVRACPHPMPVLADLHETARLIEESGRRVVAVQADIREETELHAAVRQGLDEFGRIDVVIANAGLFGHTGPFWEMDAATWREVIDTCLTGAWLTVKCAVPAMIEAGRGGAVVITSSTAGLKGMGQIADYVSAKHGLMGLMRAMAAELGEHRIRVNAVNPTAVNTPLFANDVVRRLYLPEADDPSDSEFEAACRPMHLLPVGWVEPADVTSAVMWLASDEARYVTGVALPVDAGALAK